MQRDFRADIQGLRAVAVGLVALDHANVGPFDGGFVGVDVFFVISGYLITALLLREADRTGRVSLRDFYARRARRILPAALLVIVATIGLSMRFLDGAAALLVGEQSIWATFFAANIKFSIDSTDYFAADQPASPLQHYWSLAVEEQFYLFWPLILLAALVLLRKRFDGPHKPAILVLLVATAASVAWSLYSTAHSPLSAYFSTTARAWELAIGALGAAAMPYLAKIGPSPRAVASWVGVALIGYAALMYDPSTPFPGSAAALPVVGAALLLVGGHGASGAGGRRDCCRCGRCAGSATGPTPSICGTGHSSSWRATSGRRCPAGAGSPSSRWRRRSRRRRTAGWRRRSAPPRC